MLQKESITLLLIKEYLMFDRKLDYLDNLTSSEDDFCLKLLSYYKETHKEKRRRKKLFCDL